MTAWPVRLIFGVAILLVSLSLQAQLRVETIATGFNASGDVSVSANGDIFVGNYGSTLSDSTGSNVLRITPEGEVSVFASGLTGASGNTFDSEGNLYQSNIQTAEVWKIDPQGNTEVYASGLGGGVIGLTFDSLGNLYATSCGNNLIYQITPQRVVSTFATGLSLSCPNGLTADEQDNLYTVNFNNGNISSISPQGQVSLLASTPGGTFRLGGGNGHVTYGNGVLYVVSNASGQVFEVTLDGQVTVLAGSGARGNQDGAPLDASFQFPNGIDISPDGTRLYLNESQDLVLPFSSNYPLTPSRLRMIVLSEEPPIEINAGLSGSWYEPATSGQGFNIDVIPSSNTLFAGWFTYTFGEPSDQRWLTLQGPYEGAVATLGIFETTGGIFDDPQDASTRQVGDAVLTFLNCQEALLEYQFDDGPADTMELQQLLSSGLCESLQTEPEVDIPLQVERSQPTVFLNVNVLTMADSGLLPGQTVVVRDGVIEAMGAAGSVLIPQGSAIIDGTGRYLAPGLTEMHLHISVGGRDATEQAGLLMIANGVTTALNMGDSFLGGIPIIGDQFASGQTIGPRLYAGNVAYGQDGNGDKSILTPEQATQYANRLSDQNYDFIKEYWFLSTAVLDRFEAESQRLDLPIIGHIPRTRPMADSLSRGHTMAAHIQEPYVTLMNSQENLSAIPLAVQMFLDNGTYMTPTLAVFESYTRVYGGVEAEFDTLSAREGEQYTHPAVKQQWRNWFNSNTQGNGQQPGGIDSQYEFFEIMTREFNDAGIPLLIGTDAPGFPGVMSGYAAHVEMALFQKAGIPIEDILAAATRNAGSFIDETLAPAVGFGTVEVGKRGDLILLEANPLDDLDNLKQPLAVMADGRLWSRTFLDQALNDLQVSFFNAQAESSVTGAESMDLIQDNGHWHCVEHLEELR